MAIVQKNVKIIAEALASYIYNIKDGEIFTGSMVTLSFYFWFLSSILFNLNFSLGNN